MYACRSCLCLTPAFVSHLPLSHTSIGQKGVVTCVHLHSDHWTLCSTRIFTTEVDDRLVSFDTSSDYDDGLRGADGTSIVSNITRWLSDEFQDKKRRRPDPKPKHSISSMNEGPAQNDGCNCGVMALQTARLRVAEVPLSFTSSDMPYFRERIVQEILCHRLLLEEPPPVLPPCRLVQGVCMQPQQDLWCGVHSINTIAGAQVVTPAMAVSVAHKFIACSSGVQSLTASEQSELLNEMVNIQTGSLSIDLVKALLSHIEVCVVGVEEPTVLDLEGAAFCLVWTRRGPHYRALLEQSDGSWVNADSMRDPLVPGVIVRAVHSLPDYLRRTFGRSCGRRPDVIYFLPTGDTAFDRHTMCLQGGCPLPLGHERQHVRLPTSAGTTSASRTGAGPTSAGPTSAGDDEPISHRVRKLRGRANEYDPYGWGRTYGFPTAVHLRHGWAKSADAAPASAPAAARDASPACAPATAAPSAATPAATPAAAPAATPAAAPAVNDPFEAAHPPIHDVGQHINPRMSIKEWRSTNGGQRDYSHVRQDCPLDQIPFQSPRAQWLLHGFDTAQTGMTHVIGFLSILERTKRLLRSAKWAWQGMPEPTPAERRCGFHLITPDTITEDEVTAFNGRLTLLIHNDMLFIDKIGSSTRLPWDQQPCERFAWMEHAVWAWNMSRGRCANPKCNCVLELKRAHETVEDIYDDIGKHHRGAPDNAFSLQRRAHQIVHVGSNISGALCQKCNRDGLCGQNLSLEPNHGTRPEGYPEFGGPKEFWNISIQLNIFCQAPPPQFGSYSMLQKHVRQQLISENFVPCQVRAGGTDFQCPCAWHQEFRKRMQTLTAAVGQSVDELHQKRNEQRRRNRQQKHPERQRKRKR